MNTPRRTHRPRLYNGCSLAAMDDAPMTFLHILLALFALAAADLMMSVLENRLHGARLLFLAPLPAAIIAGVFALTYVVVISVDRLERFYWTASLVLGVWA